MSSQDKAEVIIED